MMVPRVTCPAAGIALASVMAVLQLHAQQPGGGGILIRQGEIVSERGRIHGDIRVRDGVIAEIGDNLPASGERVIEAKGLLVLPGGVDPHVHLSPASTDPARGADDYTTASRQAFAGGKTTISNFVVRRSGESVDEMLARETALVDAQSMADVILHVMAFNPQDWGSGDVEALASRGIGLKVFLSRPSFDQQALEYVKMIERAGAAGMLTLVHCEDASLIGVVQERMMAEGRGQLKGQNFALSRPVVAEELATQRAVAISEVTGAPIFIVHISSERALRAAETGHARGLPVFTEVRFLYLHLTRERFDEPDAPIYTADPPLRDRSDLDYLWGAIARGSVSVVDTDHVGYTRAEKLDPKLDIVNHRPAGNYLQVQLPLLYSEGVRKGRISLEQMVAVSATNPAKLFGIYPQKGTIAVGSDADLVLWDPVTVQGVLYTAADERTVC
jgi:dihydropyrimidinase